MSSRAPVIHLSWHRHDERKVDKKHKLLARLHMRVCSASRVLFCDLGMCACHPESQSSGDRFCSGKYATRVETGYTD